MNIKIERRWLSHGNASSAQQLERFVHGGKSRFLITGQFPAAVPLASDEENGIIAKSAISGRPASNDAASHRVTDHRCGRTGMTQIKPSTINGTRPAFRRPKHLVEYAAVFLQILPIRRAFARISANRCATRRAA